MYFERLIVGRNVKFVVENRPSNLNRIVVESGIQIKSRAPENQIRHIRSSITKRHWPLIENQFETVVFSCPHTHIRQQNIKVVR